MNCAGLASHSNNNLRFGNNNNGQIFLCGLPWRDWLLLLVAPYLPKWPLERPEAIVCCLDSSNHQYPTSLPDGLPWHLAKRGRLKPYFVAGCLVHHEENMANDHRLWPRDVLRAFFPEMVVEWARTIATQICQIQSERPRPYCRRGCGSRCNLRECIEALRGKLQ